MAQIDCSFDEDLLRLRDFVSLSLFGSVLAIIFTSGILGGNQLFYAHMLWTEMVSKFERPENEIRIKPCERCNVVMIVLDTLRADFLGRSVNGRKLTPHLDAIAEQGLVFTHAFANAFFTTPSHVTLMSSIYPHSHQVTFGRSKILDERFVTLAQQLKINGYSTRAATPNTLRYLEENLGLYRGFDQVLKPLFRRAVLRDARDPGFDFEGWQRLTNGLAKPYFLFLHSYLAHMPYLAPDLQRLTPVPLSREALLNAHRESGESKQGRYGSGEDALAHEIGDLQQQRLRLYGDNGFVEEAYARNVSDMDAQLAKFWAEARRLPNTIFVFLSDHGEQLFEHGKPGHATFFDHTVRVPLIIVGPGVPIQKSSKLVSLVDMAPTILDLLGIEIPAQMQGKSVFLKDSSIPPQEEIVFGHTFGQDFVRTRKWKLLFNKFAEPELYYLPLDPGEKKNLAESSNWFIQSVKRRLEEEIERWKLATALR